MCLETQRPRDPESRAECQGAVALGEMAGQGTRSGPEDTWHRAADALDQQVLVSYRVPTVWAC